MKIGKMFLIIILKLVKKNVSLFHFNQKSTKLFPLCMRIIFLQHYLHKKYKLLNLSPIHHIYMILYLIFFKLKNIIFYSYLLFLNKIQFYYKQL